MKLSKLSMPKKKSEKEMGDEYGLEMADSESSDSMEMEAALEGEEAMPPTEDMSMGSEALAGIPDEELLAEIQKRGLEKQLGKGKPAPASPEEESAEGELFA